MLRTGVHFFFFKTFVVIREETNSNLCMHLSVSDCIYMGHCYSGIFWVLKKVSFGSRMLNMSDDVVCQDVFTVLKFDRVAFGTICLFFHTYRAWHCLLAGLYF